MQFSCSLLPSNVLIVNISHLCPQTTCVMSCHIPRQNVSVEAVERMARAVKNNTSGALHLLENRMSLNFLYQSPNVLNVCISQDRRQARHWYEVKMTKEQRVSFVVFLELLIDLLKKTEI